jgi:hypothetical protein
MEKLAEFLVNAKRNTYAAQKGRIESSRKHSIDFAYKEGDYYYTDSYFGSTYFSGEEIVYHNDLPVWSMNYYGKVLIVKLPNGFGGFLKEALKKVGKEKPFRGPEKFINGGFRYECLADGGISFFSGTEYIYYNNKKIYKLKFHGGEIK